jgi:hypothetical protein
MSHYYQFTAERVTYNTTFEAEISEGLTFRVGACIDHGDNVNRCDLVEIKLPSGKFDALAEPISWMDDDLCNRAVTEYQSDRKESASLDRYQDRLEWERNR